MQGTIPAIRSLPTSLPVIRTNLQELGPVSGPQPLKSKERKLNSLRTTFARVLGTASITTLVLGIFLALQPVARAQNLVYAVTNTAGFGTLDLDSGTYTQLGTSQAQLAGLGELGANLYGGELNTGAFYQVNLSDGSLTQLTPGIGSHFRGFGAITAGLYAINTSGDLCYVYLVPSPEERCYSAPAFGAGTLAMSADGTTLYVTLDPGTGSLLYSLNTTTGTATLIGPTDVSNITSLVFRHGTLYAVAANKEASTPSIPRPVRPRSTRQFLLREPWCRYRAAGDDPQRSAYIYRNGRSDARAGLTVDRAGNLYGTTWAGGDNEGDGTVFKLTKHTGGWTFARLFAFDGGNGANPLAPVTIASNGALFGTTSSGGNQTQEQFLNFESPPSFCRSIDCPWGETTLEIFSGSGEPAGPNYGALVFDSAGNLYGVTEGGGEYGQGAVYELMPAGGNWTLSVVYSFQNNNQDGRQPYSGVIFDNSGNLYGTTRNGGASNNGTVYELSPSGGSWTETILYNFAGYPSDGQYPIAGLLFDGVNNFYGTASEGGPYDGGTVYRLTNSGGTWNYSLIYSFPNLGSYSSNPFGGVIMDAIGNLYGTTSAGGQGYGSVYELTPSNGWIYSELYDFTTRTDGDSPYGSLVLDSAGNLYGTASCSSNCAQGNDGNVYRLTPQ